MKIQLIRNATLRLTYGGLTFLVDPRLADQGTGRSYAGRLTSPLVQLPMAPEEVIRDIDAVLVSHLHSDHFDERAIELLPKDIPLLTPATFAQKIRERGFTEVTAIESAVRFGEVEIGLTPGQHGPESVLGDMGEVFGFVFRASGEPALYWAGDTILIDPVRDVLRRERPDVVVVHGCGALWKGDGPIVMDAGMVAETLDLAPGATVVATHLEAVDHGVATRDDLWALTSRLGDAGGRLRIPADGEVMAFGA